MFTNLRPLAFVSARRFLPSGLLTSCGRKLLLCVIAVLAMPLPTLAQEGYPSRPIRIVIPTTAGGSLDVLARVIADKLTSSWGQPVIVESKAGAGTVLATSAVAKSPADGYTVLFTSTGFVQSVLLLNPPYKASDLAPVSMVAIFPIAMAANAKLPVNNVGELLKLARASSSMSYGSYGMGSGAHILGEGLNKAGGVQITHVPYKGEAASYADLVSGQLSVAYGSVGFYSRQLSTGKVKLLAVASPKRLKDFPNLPTIAEAGYPDLNICGWGGMFMPAGTPPAIVEKFSQEIRRIVALPDVQAKIYDWGFEPVGNSSAEFAETISTDLRRWGAVIKASNIKLE